MANPEHVWEPTKVNSNPSAMYYFWQSDIYV